MRINEELKERLLTASRSELEAIRVENPEIAGLIDRLFCAEQEIGAWLGDGAASTPQEPEEGVSSATVLPIPRRGRLRPVLVAAASLALVFAASSLLDSEAPGRSQEDITPSSVAAVPIELNFEAESDYAVFPTKDPDIAVVWLLNGDEE